MKKASNRKHGVYPLCKDCHNKENRDYKRKNKAKIASYNKRYRFTAAYKAYQQRYKKDNAQKIKDRVKKHREANLDKRSAYQSKRRASAVNATPKWLTKEQLNEIMWFYAVAKELQWLSEDKLEVDHIEPLLGKDVCGLHVPWNLQILPSSLNRSHGNRRKTG
jgi:hypothetical protein